MGVVVTLSVVQLYAPSAQLDSDTFLPARPASRFAPIPEQWSLPDDDTADHVACSGRGTWLAAGEGGCSCHTGYMGIDCKECWVGWERHPGMCALTTHGTCSRCL